MREISTTKFGEKYDMPRSLTEQEIETALQLSAQRDFEASLALYQAMIERATNVQDRIKILFGIVTCSTWLKRYDIKNKAIEELRVLPDYPVSRAFVVLTEAKAFDDFGESQKALTLIDENLRSEVLQRSDFQDWRYEHLFLKGRYLVQLGRYDEALSALKAASDIYAKGDRDLDIQIERSNCFIALSRYEDAYEAAKSVLNRGDADMATLAMQHMAESRMWQSRVPEALEIYSAILKRLPSKFVQEERIQKGVRNAMAYLEKTQPHRRPS